MEDDDEFNNGIRRISIREQYRQNIYDNSDMSEGNYLIQQLGNVVKKLYEKDLDKFLNETVSNVRYIGHNVFGLSKDMVFSNITEQKIANDRESDIEK